MPKYTTGVEIPDPVFMCSIEPPSMASQKALDEALKCLTKEDPSLRYNCLYNISPHVSLYFKNLLVLFL